MRKVLSLLAFLLCVSNAWSILYKCDDFNTSKKTCSLVGWGGTQPTSGKLKLPSTFTHTDGVTYTITKVAKHALDNLTTVTEITIPAEYVWFGNVHDTQVVNSTTENFFNCPKLVRFIVDAKSPIFETTPKGLLLLKGKKELIKVPQSFETTGNLTIPDGIEYISEEALVENLTITSLKIPQNVEIFKNGGINRMKGLRKIELVDVRPHKLTMINSVLIQSGRVVGTVPSGGLTSFSIPENVNKISSYAFYNVTSLTDINIPSRVYEIGDYAFAYSGISSLTIPEAVKTLEGSIIRGCDKLKTLRLEMTSPHIPDNFASGCSSLERVSSENIIITVGESAFKNCRELKEFPFRGETKLSEDSAFFNTGFEEVVFEKSYLRSYNAGSSLFENCRNLKKIDWSNVIIERPEEIFAALGPYFATGCKKLETVVFPRFLTFWNYTQSPGLPAFGYSCGVDTISISTCWGMKSPQFIYSPTSNKKDFTPHVYAALTQNTDLIDNWQRCPLGKMFSAGNGATVSPVIFMDACDEDPEGDYEQNMYVDPNATYFIPGGCTAGYPTLVESGCRYEEMYEISFSKNGWGGLKVKVRPKENIAGLNAITDIWVRFDGNEKHSIFSDGTADSSTKFGDVKFVRLFYTIDGHQMSTDYFPTSWISTGIDEPESEVDVEGAGEIYDLLGRKVESLKKGIYLVKKNGKFVKSAN